MERIDRVPTVFLVLEKPPRWDKHWRGERLRPTPCAWNVVYMRLRSSSVRPRACVCVCMLSGCYQRASLRLSAYVCVCERLRLRTSANVCVCAQKIKRLHTSRRSGNSSSRHVFCSRAFGTYYIFPRPSFSLWRVVLVQD